MANYLEVTFMSNMLPSDVIIIPFTTYEIPDVIISHKVWKSVDEVCHQVIK